MFCKPSLRNKESLNKYANFRHCAHCSFLRHLLLSSSDHHRPMALLSTPSRTPLLVWQSRSCLCHLLPWPQSPSTLPPGLEISMRYGLSIERSTGRCSVLSGKASTSETLPDAVAPTSCTISYYDIPLTTLTTLATPIALTLFLLNSCHHYERVAVGASQDLSCILQVARHLGSHQAYKKNAKGTGLGRF